MKRILVLAYYFPPHGGAGVQRTVKFLKAWPALGYESVVLTGPSSTALGWAPPDASLLADIPVMTEIHRLPDPEPSASGRWRGRAERWLTLRSPFSRWWVDGATALGLELASGVDVVYASMSPFETAEAAAGISASSGKPWVADLRDPWALDEWTRYPTGLHRRLDGRRMRRALATASTVVLNTPEAERAVRERFPELADRVTTIPNGWDQDDFSSPVGEHDDGPFRIVHVGYVHDRPTGTRWSGVVRRSFGGETAGLVPEARSYLFILEAVRRVSAEDGFPIEIHLAGAARPIRSDGLEDHGYLSHPEAIALLRSADLLFLPMHDLAPGIRSRTVPGKTYEYLASGVPILAALPDGDARDLLSGLPDVWLCRPRDVDCMAEAIRSFRMRRRAGRRVPTVAHEYERRRLAARLVEVFDAVSGSPTPEHRAGAASTSS